MTTLALRLWQKVNEPRVISALYAAIYTVAAWGGFAALIEPPMTLEGAIGTLSMRTLAIILTFGGVVGAVAVLPGIWWLERTAVVALGAAAAIYGIIVAALHMSSPGNRRLQLAFVLIVLLMQAVRWHRIRERPYDPDRSSPRT